MRINSVSAGMLGDVHSIVRGFNERLDIHLIFELSQTDAHRDLLKSGLLDC